MLGKALAVLSILATAAILLFSTSVANFAGNQAITAVEEGVKPITSQVPNSDMMIQTGHTVDDLNTLAEDGKNVRTSWTKGISNTMTFGFPIMIVLAAGLAIFQKLR